MQVLVSEADFDQSEEYQQILLDNPNAGAVIQFVGRVRGLDNQRQVNSLHLSHYPGMTENLIRDICDQAIEQWRLNDVRVIHRVGQLTAGAQIVLVTVAASHRAEAFAGCEYVMDALKTQATFWKKELGPEGDQWLDMKQKDKDRMDRWQATDSP